MFLIIKYEESPAIKKIDCLKIYKRKELSRTLQKNFLRFAQFQFREKFKLKRSF
jgi:hypothetical protein